MDFDDILRRVRKPGRYLGCEVNTARKDPARVTCRVALAYPDLYELAMSYLGIQVLYDTLNREEDLWAERVFAPDRDLEAESEKAELPLCSLESRTPLNRFDVVGFTLQHELNYPDVLAMLRMGGIPVPAAQRDREHPFVIAGGPCCSNPEPLSPALDAVFLGDAETGVTEIARIVGRGRRDRLSREEILDRLMAIPSVYIPARYRVSYATDGLLQEVKPLLGAPARIRRRLLPDLDAFTPPQRPIVPVAEAVHSRLTVEIQRGCTHGCRFCHAGMINRPVRQRSLPHVLASVRRCLESTGFDEVSFLSLSAGDHPNILPILEGFFRDQAGARVAASLPSLRAETLTPQLARLVQTVRKSGFTIAPEAGTERLRRVINKQLSESDVLRAASGAFEAGWRLIKLYFMVGLPSERPEDREAIVTLVDRMRSELRAGGHRPRIHVGLSLFVPKPHTPFQWEAMADRETSLLCCDQLRKGLRSIPGVKVGWSRIEASWAEGLLARGDRRQFEALCSLFASGDRLCGWSEHFRTQRFEEAFGGPGRPVTPDWYLRERAIEEVLPWDHLDMGPSRAFLLAERRAAFAGEPTPDCSREGCLDCGACDEGISPIRDLTRADEVARSTGADRSPEPARIRVRLILAKTGPAIFIGHLEYKEALLRAMRRAGWPLAFSAGFHPQPKTSFGPACPVGVESRTEIVDVTLCESREVAKLLADLARELPTGFQLLEGRVLREGEGNILHKALLIRYRMKLPADLPLEEARRGAEALMQRGSWLTTRQGKKAGQRVDVRPGLLRLEVLQGAEGPEAVCELLLDNRATARPAEITWEAWQLRFVRCIREAIVPQEPVASEGAPP